MINAAVGGMSSASLTPSVHDFSSLDSARHRLSLAKGTICRSKKPWKRTQKIMVSQMLQNSTTCIFIFSNLYLCSTKYIFIQQFTVIFNILYLCSTIRILFSYSTKLFSFNNNIYSTSIAIFILLNKINYSTSVQTFYSKTIIIQLLPCIVI